MSTTSAASARRGHRRQGAHRSSRDVAITPSYQPVASVGSGAGSRAAAETGQNRGVLEMPREEFEGLVSAALDELPAELAALMDNVAVFVEDEPPPEDPDLLGIYEGTPLTERDWSYGGVLPDRIVVFRGPTLRYCQTEEEVVEEVHVTVVHEIAHHFGIDDRRLHELGYS
jgi:predicted Zn-dependent protease with MMP-like domain